MALEAPRFSSFAVVATALPGCLSLCWGLCSSELARLRPLRRLAGPTQAAVGRGSVRLPASVAVT